VRRGRRKKRRRSPRSCQHRMTGKGVTLRSCRHAAAAACVTGARLTPHGCLAQVDFEFFDLAPIDFHGLRALLARYLDGEQPFAVSELAEELIAQV
jgi:hypothetical protein